MSRSRSLGEDRGDGGVEGQKAALDALQSHDGGEQFGAGRDPHW